MAELHVSKKNILELFGKMQGKLFTIPEYQRKYEWSHEQCETLWNDIVDFYENSSVDYYFLGTIVYAENKKKLDVIDGQQRLTSLFLLLRSIYAKLDKIQSNNQDELDVINNLKNKIAPCIWEIDELSGKVQDKKKIHLESLVAIESENRRLHQILETGEVDDNAVDNYSKNYRFFEKWNDEYASKNPLGWKNLCLTILQKCILLPIICEDFEMALTIFSTLNDRGLPLTDADIFKAAIYRALPDGSDGKRQEFTEKWKLLDELVEGSFITIDDMFRYYTHVLRAQDQDKSKEIGLRKYYLQKKPEILKQDNIIDRITDLAYFWKEINTGSIRDEQTYTISFEAKKYLQCLNFYPNEFWKYAVSTYFYINKDSETFELDFEEFVKNLTAYLVAKFIEYPTVNKIKDDIYSICISIALKNDSEDDEKEIDLKKGYFVKDLDLFKKKVADFNSSKLTKCLLLIDAYQNKDQSDLINSFEIEHIFPKKWQDSNYNGWSEDDAQDCLEKLGNKIVFEKKLNIQAGNGYFGRKKEKYQKSKIACVIDLGNMKQDDWVKSDIDTRELEIVNRLCQFFKLLSS